MTTRLIRNTLSRTRLLPSSVGSTQPPFSSPPSYHLADRIPSGKGGATKRAPLGGFNDAGLEKLLAFNNPPAEPSNSKIGAIAGGVVGGLAVVATAAGVFLFLRRRRQQRENAGTLASPSYGQQSLPAELKATDTIAELRALPHAQEYHPPVEMYVEPHVPPIELSAGDAHARGLPPGTGA